jgi:hypothetical protein
MVYSIPCSTSVGGPRVIEKDSASTDDRVDAARQPSLLQIAANRRNALNSTGPKTPGGKRRAALNRLSRNLCSKGLERQLWAHGEDLREFWPLHRDLIAIFQPQGEAAVRAVEWLARTWWEKARRIRHWVAAGPARSEDLDARLDELLRFLVHLLRERHEWWQHRLVSVLELPLGSPADVRRQIESRLFIFGGAKPGRRKYPRRSTREDVLKELEEVFGRILAGQAASPAQGPYTKGQ